MVNDETRRKLRLLNIGEFVEELEIQQQDPQTLALPFDDRFQMLTDSVYQRKYNDKVQRLIKNAKLRLLQKMGLIQDADHFLLLDAADDLHFLLELPLCVAPVKL